MLTLVRKKQSVCGTEQSRPGDSVGEGVGNAATRLDQKSWGTGKEDVVEGDPLPGDRKIRQAIGYMLQHLNKQLQVAKLAALVNVSPSHFFALFKRQTGCPPIDFFIRLRMQHACQLLDETSLNVKEVAGVLGYDDPFYFSRAFKGVNHVAPSEYRMMSKQGKDALRQAALPAAFLNNSPARSEPPSLNSASGSPELMAGRDGMAAQPVDSHGTQDEGAKKRIVHGKRTLSFAGKDKFCCAEWSAECHPGHAGQSERDWHLEPEIQQ